MKEIGQTFRILRKERGFTLKTMSDGIISFSYLSKFEKGESQISLINFTRLLERLNMTVDEFLFSSGIQANSHMHFFQKISNAYVQNNLTDLKYFFNMEENLYEETKILYHKFNALMTAVVIKELESDFLIPDSDIHLFVNYFLKCSYWTTYEVSLFGNMMPLFTNDLLIILLEEIKKRIKDYKVMYRNHRDLVGIIQNACIILLREKKVKEAKSLSEFLETVIQREHFFAKARKVYIDGVITMASGAKEAGRQEVLKAIEIIDVFDQDYAEKHRLEFKDFQKIYW